MDFEELRNAEVVELLPDIFGRNESVPEGLVGSTVLRVGTLRDTGLAETGGLVIDFLPTGSAKPRRLVLAFNDISMWVEAEWEIEI